jgi:hypothetical protein
LGFREGGMGRGIFGISFLHFGFLGGYLAVSNNNHSYIYICMYVYWVFDIFDDFG